jgi:hypothetical protein
MPNPPCSAYRRIRRIGCRRTGVVVPLTIPHESRRGPLPPAIRIQRILGSQLRRMEVVQAMLPAETSARLTMVERLQAILGSNLSVGRHSARSERLICEPCGV